jgi:hypothetical protein
VLRQLAIEAPEPLKLRTQSTANAEFGSSLLIGLRDPLEVMCSSRT